jgi:hypothetical protein
MDALEVFDQAKIGFLAVGDGLKYGVLSDGDQFDGTAKTTSEALEVFIIYSEPTVDLAVTVEADNDAGHPVSLKVEWSEDGGQNFTTMRDGVPLNIEVGQSSASTTVAVPRNCTLRLTLDAQDDPILVEHTVAGIAGYGNAVSLTVAEDNVAASYSLRYNPPSPTSADLQISPFAWILVLGALYLAFEFLIRRKDRA